MQKIATNVFIISSITFGLIGLAMVFSGQVPGPDNTEPNKFFIRALFTTVFILLPSFALSVAGKYLSDKNQSK